jgi:hypothetical protein
VYPLKEFAPPSQAIFRKFRCEMGHSQQMDRVVLPTAIQSVTRPARCILVDVARYVPNVRLEALADRMAAIRMVWK